MDHDNRYEDGERITTFDDYDSDGYFGWCLACGEPLGKEDSMTCSSCDDEDES